MSWRLLKVEDLNYETRILTCIRKGGKRHHLKLMHFETPPTLEKREMDALQDFLFLSTRARPFSHRGLFQHMRSILNKRPDFYPS